MRPFRLALIIWFAVACASAPQPIPTEAPTMTPIPPSQTPAPPTATTMPSPTPDAERVANWRQDLNLLKVNMPSRHPNLFWRVSEAEFEAAVDKLEAEIPALTDEQIIVEISRIVSIADGHSFMPLFQAAVDFQLYPIRMYQFSDGLYVVSADEPYADLTGARVVSIGRMNAEEAYAAVTPIMPHDNEMTTRLLAPVYLNVPEVLLALGVIDDAAEPGFVLVKPDGTQTTVNLAPTSSARYRDWLSTHLVLAGVPGAGAAGPLWLSHKGKFFWYEHLEDTNTLYIQYNLVWDTAGWTSGQTIQDFAAEVDAFATEQQVERTIVDVRHNLGGSDYRTLAHMLRDNPLISQPGHLYVLAGRQTFSGAIQFAVELEETTDVLFVGEPTGGRPNFYSDQQPVVLPNSGIEVLISTRYKENSTPDDTRPWIEPDILVELSSADYFAGRDPVLEAVLSAEDLQ